jgi:hypothetical protein
MIMRAIVTLKIELLLRNQVSGASLLCPRTHHTLYIDGMVVFNNLRYNGEGESVFHLMSQEHVL